MNTLDKITGEIIMAKKAVKEEKINLDKISISDITIQEQSQRCMQRITHEKG